MRRGEDDERKRQGAEEHACGLSTLETMDESISENLTDSTSRGETNMCASSGLRLRNESRNISPMAETGVPFMQMSQDSLIRGM